MNERIKTLRRLAIDELNQQFFSCPDNWDELVQEKVAELIVRQCGYYADIFEATGCPADMDITETKPSDYIKKNLGVK